MSTSDITHTDTTPTVVLVHGAFVDASSWNGVIAELEAAGIDVVAPPNLLRGVGVDAAYLTGFVEALGRPTVLVGHSYAGAVISQAGSDAKGVVGLVFVAAFAPEAGETLAAINARYPDVPLAAAQRTFTYTSERGEQATDTFVERLSFRDAVCADLPADSSATAAIAGSSAAAAALRARRPDRKPSPFRSRRALAGLRALIPGEHQRAATRRSPRPGDARTVTRAASWRLTEKTHMTSAVRRQACRRGLDEAVSPKDVDEAVQEAATEVS